MKPGVCARKSSWMENGLENMYQVLSLARNMLTKIYISSSLHWDCPYEESQEFILLSKDLTVLCKKHIGHIYSTVILENHEAVAEDQVLFHCNNDVDILVTAKSGLLHSSPPFFTTKKIKREYLSVI